jgi:CRISPR-associated protein (TIGR02710 family)
VKVLFVTVGGSFQPIVTAIDTLRPERVVFICSTGPKGSEPQVVGPGTPCEIRQNGQVTERLPNIPTQASLGERFVRERDLVLIDDPDDIAGCYERIAAKVKEVVQEGGTSATGADYAGGTKTMSVALVLSALDYGVPLYITTGKRTDIVKVTQGELTSRLGVSSLSLQRFLDKVLPNLLQTYEYSAARNELKRLLASGELSAAVKRQAQRASDYCAGFDAWDKFDHRGALESLKHYMDDPLIKPLALFLKRVISSRARIDEEFSVEGGAHGHGYELVEDLLLNAERRAAQGRFDDAVSRIYRALELLAQMRLLEGYGFRTDAVEIARLPEGLRARYEPGAGPLPFALLESYHLLSELGDTLGTRFAAQESRIKDKLKVRNLSNLAHGFRPVARSEYEGFVGVIAPFIREGISQLTSKRLDAPQFPNAF